jgi:hypothetical protein
MVTSWLQFLPLLGFTAVQAVDFDAWRFFSEYTLNSVAAGILMHGRARETHCNDNASVSRKCAALIGNRWPRNRRSFPLDALDYLA